MKRILTALVISYVLVEASVVFAGAVGIPPVIVALTLLAGVVSLTPGTVSAEIDERRRSQAIANLTEVGLQQYVDSRLGDAHKLAKQLKVSAGTVKRILVEDGAPVEFGAPLMVIE